MIIKKYNKIVTFSAPIKDHHFVCNYYKTKYPKNILISYITHPFRRDIKEPGHSNEEHAIIIASVFRDLGYNIDVMDWYNNFNFKLNLSKYDIIFGFGDVFESSFHDSTFKGLRIHFATTAHPFYHNTVAVNRILEANTLYNCNLLPKRNEPKTWTLTTAMSDAVIIIGNEWTCSTYQQFVQRKYYFLNAAGLYNSNVNYERDISKCKKSFLWLGGFGLMHKGFDLCVNAFKHRPDLDLHICGIPEEDVLTVFKDELNLQNIHFHGFTNIKSEKFKEIVQKCMFTILPSCSEGQATSLLTTMATGLIPIVTKQTGVTINDSYGFNIAALTLDSVLAALDETQRKKEEELIEMSDNVKKIIEKDYSMDSFNQNFKQILLDIL